MTQPNDANLLILTHNYPRHSNDYVGGFIENLCKGISGFSIEVGCPSFENAAETETRNGVKISHIKYGADVFYRNLSYASKGSALFGILSFIRNAYKHYKTKRYSIINAHWWMPAGIVAYLLWRKNKTPYIITCHGADITIIKKHKIFRPFAKLILKNAAAVTTVSPFMKSLIYDLTGVDSLVMPMPYNNEIFKPAAPGSRIVSVGRLTVRKGYDRLIKAFEPVSKEYPIELLIYGEGPEESNLRQLIASLGLESSVHLKGRVSPNEVPGILKDAEIFIIPSIVDKNFETESFGIVILEAMATGIPVIACNVGGISSLIQSGVDGILVDPDDNSQMTGAIRQLLDSCDLRESFRTAALRKVSNHTIESVGNGYTQLFKKYVG